MRGRETMKYINYKLGNEIWYRGNHKVSKSTLYELIFLYMRGRETMKYINYKLGNKIWYRVNYKVSKSTLYELIFLYMRGKEISLKNVK
jgi:hypothetical protein